MLQLYGMDISPNYAATINGVAGGLACFGPVFTSEMFGNLITGNVRSNTIKKSSLASTRFFVRVPLSSGESYT